MPDPFKKVKIIELMELFDDDEVTTADQIDRPQQALDREAYEDFMKRNPLAGGGMLVEPGFGGVRQGYAKEKPLIKREQNIFKNYLKARKEVGLNVPSDDNKQKIKSKIRTGTIDNQTIKNLKETYRYKNEDQRLRYDTKLKRWEKTAGRDQTNYIQKKGESVIQEGDEKSWKKFKEMYIEPSYLKIQKYLDHLQECLNNYKKRLAKKC